MLGISGHCELRFFAPLADEIRTLSGGSPQAYP